MELKLTVTERLVISNLFPEKTNLQNQIIVKDISESLQMTQEEMENIEFKVNPDNSSYSWNKEKAVDKVFEISKSEIVFLQDRVNELDKKNEITAQIVDLCLKIKDLKVD